MVSAMSDTTKDKENLRRNEPRTRRKKREVERMNEVVIPHKYRLKELMEDAINEEFERDDLQRGACEERNE